MPTSDETRRRPHAAAAVATACKSSGADADSAYEERRCAGALGGAPPERKEPDSQLDIEVLTEERRTSSGAELVVESKTRERSRG